MNIFKNIRSLFGLNTEVSEAPIDQLDTINLQGFEIDQKIEKANSEFSQIDNELSLKIQACDVLIEKGVKEGSDNKRFLVDRLDRITNSHLELIKGLIDEKKEINEKQVELESTILTKAIEVTSHLDDEDQSIVKDQLDDWRETGLIKGEQINSQAKAITLVLEEIVKGGIGSGHYNHHKRKRILRDQENDPDIEPEGGKVADRYGDLLNKIDKKIQHHSEKIKEIDKKEADKKAQDKIDAEEREKERVANWERRYKESRANVDLSNRDIEKSDKKDTVEIDKKDFIKEHKNLVKVLESDSHEDDRKEAKEQKKELEYRGNYDKMIKKSHEPIAIEIAGKGDVEYDSPVEGHYANMIIRRSFKEGDNFVSKILFLKRASNKVIAPNQFCLPGGHIDEGETIEQAGIRELKEEANLTASSAYVIGKAKCDNGKWAFYLEGFAEGDPMLLDGESNNAYWMSRDEWIEADLIFDLKDHLVAIETSTRKISDIKDIAKAEGDIELEKGGKGSGRRRSFGSTASGKKINKNAPAGHYMYDEFSSQDHRDAAIRHNKESKKYSKMHESAPQDSYSKQHYLNLSTWHKDVAQDHESISRHRAKSESALKKADIEENVLEKGGHHPEKPNHRYIKREGSPGSYTYFYDSPDTKSKDGKSYREGLYSSNVAPKYSREQLEKIARNINAMDTEYQYIDGDMHRYNGWRNLDHKLRDLIKLVPDYQKEELIALSKPEKAKFFGLISDGNDLEKAFDIDNPFYYNNEEELIKGRAAAEGEVRVWGGIKYEKSGGKWQKVDQKKKSHSTKQLKEHVENTSTEQLKKVASNNEHPHNDAAKRELERRGGENDHWDKLEELETKFNSGNKMSSMLQLVEHLTGNKKFEDFDKEVESKLFEVSDEVSSKNLSAMQAFGRIAKVLGKSIGG